MDLDTDPALVAELAPHGRLRIALNLSNFLLVQPGPAGAEPDGVAADLGRDIAARLGVPATLVPYANAGAVADAATADEWDVAFIGAEPQREDVIAFSPAYVEIEATYLVRGDSPIRTLADVDSPGVRVVTADRSAYDLHLARTLRHAERVPAPGIAASFERFLAEGHPVLAGLKPRLLADQARLPGSRILDGRFAAIQQAIGTPRRRTHDTSRPTARATRWLAAHVAHVKASGLVAAAIARHRIQGLTVASP